jgi:membrane protein
MAPFHFREKAKRFASMMQESFREFRQNDPLRLAAATTFFTAFALPPILIIISELFGVFGNARIIRRDLFQQLSREIDRNSVSLIRETLSNVRHLPLGWIEKAAGFLFLIFVATTLFLVINSSLNQLWNLRPRRDRGIGLKLWYRAKSMGVILVAGVLFFIVVLVDSQSAFIIHTQNQLSRGFNLFLQKTVYHAISLVAVTCLFTLILKYLADGRPSWKVVIWGGIFTGILFSAGKIILNVFLSFDKVQTIYGTSTAMVLLLLFIFYSSFIFYFGACFTKILGIRLHQPILPTRHATRYNIRMEEWNGEMSPQV